MLLDEDNSDVSSEYLCEKFITLAVLDVLNVSNPCGQRKSLLTLMTHNYRMIELIKPVLCSVASRMGEAPIFTRSFNLNKAFFVSTVPITGS